LKLSTSHAGSLSSSGSVFQTVGPATGKGPTTVCVESTARHNEPVSVGGTHTANSVQFIHDVLYTP